MSEMNKAYRVKVENDHGTLYLSVTHNGYHWTSTEIPEPEFEIPLIIKELEKAFVSRVWEK